MKLQCPCGAKYSFDITSEMAREPVKFVCPGCGLDASDFVNDMIRKELAGQAAAGATPDADPAPIAAAPRLRLSQPAQPPPSQAAEEAPAPSAKPKVCPKHPGQLAYEHCVVCGKPICPKCMELFGYICSPLCKARADSHGIEVPFYEGQKSAVEAKRWRKTGLISGAVGIVVALVLGVWIWYAWFGSRPRPVFAVRFPENVYSGMSKLGGTNQIVFLRGGSLSRYDLKTRKEIWSRELLDKKKIEKEVDRAIKTIQAAIDKANNETPDFVPKMPRRDKMIEDLTRATAAALQLRVSGQNIWVIEPQKLSHFDWDSGRTLQEIPRAYGFGRLSAHGDEMLFTGENETGHAVITHINLASGESSKEAVGEPVQADAVAVTPAGAGNSAGAGLPIGRRGTDADRPLDPGKVAEQAQNLPLPARIALPAVLATAANQERTMAELNDHSKPRPAPEKRSASDRFQLIPSQYGNVEFSIRLLEEKIVSRTAMKAPAKKSALDGDLNATRTADVANEILNDMQRSRGGDTVEEDESLYQITIHLPGANGAVDWTGEVTGSPSVFPLKTVNVITANTTLVVLDKSNKKLWQAALTYKVSGGGGELEEGEAPFGQGPCVERGDTLYIFDQAVLTAFDLATGTARWRLPSVGVVGIFFDDKGMLYVNTTTASPDSIRHSRQIDITDKTSAIIYKLDPKTGRRLWSNDANGFISHLSGKFIYTMQSFDPGDEDEGNDNDLTAILRKPAFLRIRRIDPANGRMMWEVFQPRAPLDVQFDGNSIELVFKKEVQVLKFLSL
jgi:PQQ-like domain